MKRKNLLVQFLAILMAAAMAACGNIPEGAGPSGSANTNAPKERDSVVIAIGSEPETLDPTQGWGHGNAPIVQSTLVK